MSTPARTRNEPIERPPAVGRSAINEFRRARARFRQDRAAADQAAEDAVAGRLTPGSGTQSAAAARADADEEALVLLAHGEPLNLALARRRRDESASLDRRLRLTRMVAREGRLSASMASLSSSTEASHAIVGQETIDLRDGVDAPLADVVDLRPRTDDARSPASGSEAVPQS